MIALEAKAGLIQIKKPGMYDKRGRSVAPAEVGEFACPFCKLEPIKTEGIVVDRRRVEIRRLYRCSAPVCADFCNTL